MPIVNCEQCSKKFHAKPSWLKKGFGKYCSRKCQYESRKDGKKVSCFICKKEIYRPLKQLVHSRSKKYFCTKSCQTIWRNSILHTGKNHPNWKDGSSIYRGLMIKNKITAICKHCGVDDRRVLLIHHIDENRKNNKLKNLTWLCHNCHFLIHHNKAEKQSLMEILV